ncbi:MAG: penicillin-binding protein 1C [Gammaproteobacteria bacterium]|nr:penicillin-binding protein 1C [Gammaproteobacteria bacterium]
MSYFVRALLVLFIGSALLYFFSPKPTLLESHSFSSAFYDRHGSLLRLTLSEDDKYRLFAPFGTISPLLIEATLLYEDRHFYHHPGFNPLALIRAIWNSYIVRTRPMGASTITMQLARLHFQINSRTLSGKLEQLLRAVQLERHYSKQQIIEAYLNLAPYGGNIEGVAAASLIYFAKPVSKLSLPEALALSVIPQNPSARNPSREKSYQNMLTARARLFRNWLEKHPQDKKQHALMALPLKIYRLKNLPFHAPHFVNQQRAKNKFIKAGKITTTLDLKRQQQLERLSKLYIDKNRHKGLYNTAVMLLDYRSMELLAAIGSVDFYDASIQGQVDGNNAKRSPGSTLKPFVYALAMDQGLIHPMTLLKDAPKRFGAYTPENFDRGFIGPIFAKDALIYSRNVPAVNLTAQLKKPSLYEFLIRAGISGMRDEAHYGLALALGGHELTMHELVSLYALLANRGKLQPIKQQLDEKTPAALPLLSPEASFLTLDILKQNHRPDRDRFSQNSSKKMPVYWKTGTSFAFRDAWSIGIFDSYVLAVWVGNFNGEGNPAFIGRTAAAPLFFEIIDSIRGTQAEAPTNVINTNGLNITQVEVCLPSGDLPGRHCPATVSSWFIPGKSPLKVSNVYREIPINKKTGLRACSDNEDDIEMRLFEFWPSDLLRLFRHAGISRKQPPSFAPECSLDNQATKGLPPKIQSPDQNVHYAVRSSQLDKERIPFIAIADADVKKLFWFVNNRYLGSASNGETFYWKPKLTNSTVRVVDDHGRASAAMISVELVQ